MSLPVPPALGFSFTDFATHNPTTPPPGGSLDAEFNRVYTALSALIGAVAVSLNTDGTLNSAQVESAYDAAEADPPGGTNIADVPSQLSARLAQAWAEYTTGAIPADTLITDGVTGQHYSAAWWANQAAQTLSGALDRIAALENRTDVFAVSFTGLLQTVRYLGAPTLHDFGAKGDGITDDTLSVAEAFRTCPNLVVLAGNYLISATISVTHGVVVTGQANGSGPGLNTELGSRFVCAASFRWGDLFSFATEQPVCFRDVQFADQMAPVDFLEPTTRGAGAAVHITGAGTPGSTNAFSVLDQCCFSGFDVAIHLERCATTKIRANVFQAWKTAAVDASTGGLAVESSPGYITHNHFFGDVTPSTPQQYGVHTSSGYGGITHNLFIGSQQAIFVDVSGPVNLGSTMIAFNSIEEQQSYGINIVQSGMTTADAIQIENNELSNITFTTLSRHIRVSAAVSNFLYGVSISNNKFQSFLTGGASGCIEVNSGNNVLVAQNQFVGSGYYTVIVGASVTNAAVLDNISTATGVLGTYGGYNFQTTDTLFRDLLTRAVTVAHLNAHADGSQVYVTDGQQSSDSGDIIAGGSGCLAIRNRGVWTTIPRLTTGVRVNGTGGPIWIAGTGAPVSTQPLGSLWSRTDGAVGTTLYVSRGGGTWAAVAGV